MVLLAVGAGCRESGSGDGTAEIAVTNSYLECVVRDLCPDETAILCLAPPGMCPGHFDISPAQVRRLRACRVLLLFDFQQPVAQKLSRLRDQGLEMQRVPAPAGLCVPEVYLATCRQVARVLSGLDPERANHFETRLAAIERRLAALAAEVRTAVVDANLPAAAVLTSRHQERFAEWLGLRPIATFIGSDLETVAGIDHCLRQATGQEIRFVIANRQEGTGLAGALAERLHATAVTFSNFPSACEGVDGFDRLVRDNVGLLLRAAP